MEKRFNEVWKSKEGSRNVWKVQGLYGIITFRTKKQAIAWSETFNKKNEKYLNEEKDEK